MIHLFFRPSRVTLRRGTTGNKYYSVNMHVERRNQIDVLRIQNVLPIRYGMQFVFSLQHRPEIVTQLYDDGDLFGFSFGRRFDASILYTCAHRSQLSPTHLSTSPGKMHPPRSNKYARRIFNGVNGVLGFVQSSVLVVILVKSTLGCYASPTKIRRHTSTLR